MIVFVAGIMIGGALGVVLGVIVTGRERDDE